MSREHSKLRVFVLADELVIRVYKMVAKFPVEERFGLQAQIRRAAVSVPANIVEGCARSSTRDYLRFLSIALGSASELRYLLTLSKRLDFLSAREHLSLDEHCSHVLRALQRLIAALEGQKRTA